jgi:hypothetical protein
MPPSPLKFANDPAGYFDESEAVVVAARRAASEVETERELEIIAGATSG